jgi:tetratricopeptide (TPR) repeat protein
MLSIFATTDSYRRVEEIIQKEYRLSELVKVYDASVNDIELSGDSIKVNNHIISHPIDWQNVRPPYLLTNALPFSEETLLGLIFGKLGNLEKASEYLENVSGLLLVDIDMANRLQYNYPMSLKKFPVILKLLDKKDAFEQYRIQHNAAVVRHYGNLSEEIEFDSVQSFYANALDMAPNAEYKAFTAKHYASLLIDADLLDKAEAILQIGFREFISEDARFALKSGLNNIWIKQLTVPYDNSLLAKLKDNLWETLQFFESKNRKAESGLLLLDAAYVANISSSFSESLGYISKAISYFDEENLEELLGSAQLRKGVLLYTWAQSGNPQFYLPAIEAYQQALKIFRQDVAPDVFADIHHNLAVLYAEMPADLKKRGIWAGIASASFQEALNFYTKEKHAYQYGVICNNYGNALTKFPQAIHSDNYEKALFYYEEALSVRTARLPYERSITLLNFLEASWKVSNDAESFNEVRYADMVTKACEIKELVEEADMIQEAQRHLELLSELKQAHSN